MLSPTTKRVGWNTSHAVNEKLDAQLQENISRYIGADRYMIDQRLRELDKEWNIERLIETEAPTMIGLGIVLGFLKDKKWFSLSAMAAGMVLLHNTQGWYPLLPIFRRLGLRSQNEIEQERSALRVLRGDHEPYQSYSTH